MVSAYTATRFDYGNPDANDPIERVSSRPDAALILYGAMSPASSAGGLGYDIKKQNEIAQFDNVKNLRYDCPPFFIFQTHEDDPRSAMIFGKELADRGIPLRYIHLPTVLMVVGSIMGRTKHQTFLVQHVGQISQLAG